MSNYDRLTGSTGELSIDGILTPDQQEKLNQLQKKATVASMNYLDNMHPGELFPMVNMATGIGKGRIIHLVIEEQMRRKPDSRVLIIAGTKNVLVAQTHETLKDYQAPGSIEQNGQGMDYAEAENIEKLTPETSEIDMEELDELNSYDSFVYRTGKFGKESNEQGQRVNVHVATIQTVTSADRRNKLNPESYDLVIVDEVHNIGTRPRTSTVNKFQRVVGFTATAHRYSGALKSPDQYGFKIVESLSLPEAQRERWLPPLIGMQIDTKDLVDQIPTKPSGQIDFKALERVLKNSPELRPLIADRIGSIINEEGKNYKTVVAVNFVWEAYEIAKLLKERGIKVGIAVNEQASKQLHSEEIPAIGSIERYKLPESNEQSIQVLVSPYVASEGFDAPATEVLVWASPTDSHLRYTQYTGRLARRVPGKRFGVIVDCLYQTSQYGWSFNMGMWMKGDVRQMENGLIYLGPESDIKSLRDLPELGRFRRIADTKELTDLQKELTLAPEGWTVIGAANYPETISGKLAKSVNWVKPRMLQIMQRLEAEQEAQGIPPEQRKKYSGSFLDRTDKLAEHYAPEVIKELERLAQETDTAPEGWMLIGDPRTPDSISFKVGKGTDWVRPRMLQIMQRLEAEQEAQGIPPEQRKKYSGLYLGRNDRPLEHFAPEVVRELEKLAQETGAAPEGWLVIGDPRMPDSVARRLGKSEGWFGPRISQVIQRLEAEQDAQGIPPEQRKKYSGLYLNKSNHLAEYYEPTIFEELEKLAQETIVPPEGWMVIGNADTTDSISFRLCRSQVWVRPRISQVIQRLEAEQDAQGIPPEQRKKYSGLFLGRAGKLAKLFAPEVIKELERLAQETGAAPEGWMVVGNLKAANTIAGRLKKDREWVTRRIPDIVQRLEAEQDAQGIPPEQRKKHRRAYLNRGGQQVEYFSPEVVEELRKIAEEYDAPRGQRP